MEPAYPYRLAWKPPPPVNIRPANRAAVLEALEYEFPTSRRRLQDRTHLSPLTLRRACRQLLRERVVALKYGHDPDTGVACDLITQARYPVLPVLEIDETHMIWRLCTTCGESVFATVQERGPFRSFEDDLELLMSRVSVIQSAGTCGLPAEVPLQAPVLLYAQPNPRALRTVEQVLETAPQVTLTPAQAAAREIRYLPAVGTTHCVLHLALGPSATATLLARQTAEDLTSPLVPLPYAANMTVALRRAIGHTPRQSRDYGERVRKFLQDVLRSVTPDCLILEHDLCQDPARSIAGVLPSGTALHCFRFALNTPSLAHRGALRLSRRALWDAMISQSPVGTAEGPTR